jgi:hypothetical protein
MPRRLAPLLLFLTLASWAAPVLAWSPETRVHMTDEAVRLMPASLRLALETHREPLLRGLLSPMTREDDPEHRPRWLQGTLDRAVEAEIVALAETLSGPASFAEIAERFGRVAHYVADAGFPPGVSDQGGAGLRYAHFADFCEDRQERFPVVFYGHDDPDLDRGDFQAFALAVMDRARGEDAELERAYAAAGSPPNPAAFDDRSVPFAVGSLSFSRTFTDIVNVWLAVWKTAGGDMGRTPYRQQTGR